jgi:2-oxoisovalerate dehydrogenase E2 component (dihydrolipoyl transacylase)
MGERVFAMPDLGEGLEEGEIVAWLVEAGQEVDLNQPIVEVETAKATVEIPSPYAGRVAARHGSVGASIRVGAPLVTFTVAGEAEEVPAPPRTAGGPVTATPPVRRLAKELGVDLTGVAGTGPDGRITADDVRAAGSGGSVENGEAGDERIELTPTRRAIAANLSRQAALPAVTTFRTLNASAVEGLRRELGTSPLPIFVAALCRTAETHPLVNASWDEDAVVLHAIVNVGVAADTERGLMVPVVRDAGRRGLADLAAEIRRVAEAARTGTAKAEDLTGATLGVSNTGSYGSEAGTPLLTPGCAVTIAMGVIAPRALVVDGAVLAQPACTLSLTFDHRVLDGAAAGRALTDLVGLLQDPVRLRDLPR